MSVKSASVAVGVRSQTGASKTTLSSFPTPQALGQKVLTLTMIQGNLSQEIKLEESPTQLAGTGLMICQKLHKVVCHNKHILLQNNQTPRVVHTRVLS